MKNSLPKPLEDVLHSARQILPPDCVITCRALWIEPPGVDCQGIRITGPHGRYVILAIVDNQAYMEFKVTHTRAKFSFVKELDDDFVDSTALLLRRLFNNGIAPS